MDEIDRAGFSLLGLHRLVAHRGDGLLPELYDALMREAVWRQQNPNVVRFPVAAARTISGGEKGPLDGKVLAFSRPAVENRTTRKAGTAE